MAVLVHLYARGFGMAQPSHRVISDLMMLQRLAEPAFPPASHAGRAGKWQRMAALQVFFEHLYTCVNRPGSGAASTIRRPFSLSPGTELLTLCIQHCAVPYAVTATVGVEFLLRLCTYASDLKWLPSCFRRGSNVKFCYGAGPCWCRQAKYRLMSQQADDLMISKGPEEKRN